MKKVGVAILGLGVVGGGTYQILTEHREFYQRTQGVDITVESVLEINRSAARYFYEQLNAKTPEAAQARRYWKEKRGLRLPVPLQRARCRERQRLVKTQQRLQLDARPRLQAIRRDLRGKP